MRRILSTIALAFIFVHAASAQSVSDYLKLRKENGVTQAATVAGLDALTGSRVVEIQGTIKGTFSTGDKGALMVERADGQTVVVDATGIPSWLGENEVKARLLVRATRDSANGPLQATLIAAAPEQEIAEAEAKKKPAKVSRSSRSSRLASRHGTRYSRLRERAQKDAAQWNVSQEQIEPIYANFILQQNPRLSQAEAHRIAQGVLGYSAMYGVDARLVMAVLMVESGFNAKATSRTGAMGLGQLMPGTAQDLGVNDAYDTTQNLYGCVKLLRTNLESYKQATGDDFQSLVLALAAYNAGSGAVKRHGGVPPYAETQAYVKKVINIYCALCGR